MPLMLLMALAEYQLSPQFAIGPFITSREQHCVSNSRFSNALEWVLSIVFFYNNLDSQSFINSDSGVSKSGGIGVESMQDLNMQCMGILWYIQIDMQFFLVAPFYVLLFAIQKYVAMFVLILVMIGNIVLRLYYGFYYHFPAIMLFPNNESEMNVSNDGNYITMSYIKPWTRYGPYIGGMITMFCMILTQQFFIRRSNGCKLSTYSVESDTHTEQTTTFEMHSPKTMKHFRYNNRLGWIFDIQDTIHSYIYVYNNTS